MNRSAVCLIAVIMSALAVSYAADEKLYDVSEVKVIKTGSSFMYVYTDTDGQLVVRDVPPPGYLESLTALRAEQEEAPQPVEETPEFIPVMPDEPARWPGLALLLLPVLCMLSAVYIFFAPLVRRRLRETKLERIFRLAGWPVFTDVDLAVNHQRPTRIDYLVRAPAGLLVINNAHLTGKVAGDRGHDVWIQTLRNERMPIDNPLRKNASDTRTVAALLGDVPIHGQVVYTGHAELPAGMPATLQKLGDFADNLDSFETDAADQRSLDGAWRTLMRYPRANRVAVRAMGAGWKRWLHDHWRPAVSGSLLAVSVIMLSVIAVLQWMNGG